MQLPDMPLVSTKCRELLIGLLKRDPNERMTFTAFFDHPFIDLEHIPSPDSLSKAVSYYTLFIYELTIELLLLVCSCN